MKTFFNFSKGEQRGIILLLVVIVVILGLNFWISQPDTSATSTNNIVAWEQEVQDFENQKKIMSALNDSIRNAQKAERELRFHNYSTYLFPDEKKPQKQPEYFFFDPNTVTISELVELGFSQKQAEVIDRYRSRGAIFKAKSDFAKVFVVSEEMFSILEPWIIIDSTKRSALPTTTQSTASTPIFIILEINSCDTAQLKKLKGIGNVLSQKIVDYRQKLGGFYSVEQLKDIIGITPELFTEISPHLTVDATTIKKIDLNNSTFKQLLQHPYFEYHIVKNIFTYKDKNGTFQTIEQLKEMPLMYEDLYNKLVPYLTIR
ncbi:MAG: helix-hairpin-helix domain-containing protein [Bacteroidales bacterium]|nr:helix-hairpin-helix domain-containing protein [Bacteroidales bacterium]